MIDFLAGLPHYADHLLPIWWAMDPELRGTFYAGRTAAARVAAEGISPAIGRPHGDPQLCVVAAFADHKAVGRRPTVMVEHGAGQSYDGDPSSVADASYSGGRERDGVVLFLGPNERVLERNRAVYPDAEHRLVGSPRLDAWQLPTRTHMGASATHMGVPTVAISFHWDCTLVPETRSAWPHYARAIEAIAAHRDRGYELIGHGHPRLWGRIARWWEALGIEPVPDFQQVLDRADVFVADNTSAMYEFAATDRPVVVLNAPWYRRDVEHGLRFWTHSRLGTVVDNPTDLAGAISTAFTEDRTATELRRAIVRSVYPRLDGRASARAAAAIAEVADRIDLGRWRSTMGNPKAPRVRRALVPDAFPAGRLRRLGATDVDLAAARERWDAMNEPERAQMLEAFTHVTDDELAAAILESREVTDAADA